MAEQSFVFDFETLIEEWCRINTFKRRSINTSSLRFKVKRRSTRWSIHSPASSDLAFTTTVELNGSSKTNHLGVRLEPEKTSDKVTIILNSGLVKNASKTILYIPQHYQRLVKVFRRCRIVNFTDPNPQTSEYDNDESSDDEHDYSSYEEYGADDDDGASYEEDEEEYDNEQFFSRRRRNLTAYVKHTENERKGHFECTVVLKGQASIAMRPSGALEIDIWRIVHDLKSSHQEVYPEVQKMLIGLNVNQENNQVEFLLSGTAHFKWNSSQSIEWDY